MIFDDDILFPKTSAMRNASCDGTVNVIGLNMGICLFVTGIVAAAAIMGCVLLLICVKLATDRDEAKTKKASARGYAVESADTGKTPAAAPTSSDRNDASQKNTDEIAGLTTA
ncbi:unnamed protein product [Caenorhabditis sp. 36 PRJEB53466]|nr:unnamed protein product [Caenorhabditis sp. 36 PRJEB53466]